MMNAKQDRAIQRFALVMACLASLTLAAGCLTAPGIERTKLYALHPEITMEAAAPLTITLGVRPLFAARPYGTAMAFLGENHQIAYRVQEEWAELPANTVTRALTDALVATKRFADVGNAADMARPDLLLTGELRMFHENRTESPVVAELEARFELRPARDPGAFWAQTLRETVPLESDDAAAFSAAMSEAVARLAMRAAESIAVVEPPLNEKPAAAAPPRRRP